MNSNKDYKSHELCLLATNDAFNYSLFIYFKS